jgi:phage shock protein PspC (stress-responsive transcriptional regulator)
VAVFDPERWHRSHPDRRLAGVAAALAHPFALPVTAVRVGFIVLTFVTHLGPVIYGALWLLLPFSPGGRSPLERGLALVLDWLENLRGEPPAARPSPPRSEPPDRADGSASSFTATTLPGGPLA